MSRDLADLSSGHLPALASPGLRSIGALVYPGRVSLAACWWLQLTSCRRPPPAARQGGWRAAQSRVSASVLPWALLNCCRAAVRWINKRGSASASHLPTLIPFTLVQQPPPLSHSCLLLSLLSPLTCLGWGALRGRRRNAS